ncbi:2-octaprenyl-6-methoxyphenyl hydroxylase [Spartinivicinus poritis]|uniref:2-octaprenyl-6-methoxyphenyl hydroxylase n=1 Tax=Spartinivicinus poritis TaxID=2994640 RepID=A0ABT5U835_9GAMM|nr:2-octaprenyl-6-methoxyphenyl hydroxylase [Spartinivicinus sp. A2-2]MDE1462534.1 2-octaprenyl-6-methoxyphenyl hydroxylase [Spartinivicinus sp. A2-2]
MTEANKPDNHFPVVVIGGGMVGASLALALQTSLAKHSHQSSMPVAIIEPHPINQANQQPSYDARSTALSLGSQLLLEQLGVWQSLAQHATAIKHIHVSDQGRFGFTRMNTDEYQLDAFGYVVANQQLGQNLFKVIKQYPAIELLSPATACQVKPLATGYAIEIEQGEKKSWLTTDLLVIADGGRSPLITQLGINVQCTDYHQTAMIANVTTSKPNQGQAFERFTEQGPMALLPLAKNHSALIWSIYQDQAPQWLDATDSSFLNSLQQHFGYRLGRFTKIGQRFHYPLSLKYSTEQIRPGLVILGNAAHALHPVAGQGFNLALRDTLQLASLLKNSWEQQEAINDYAILRRYLALQENDQIITMLGSDWLVKAFSNQHAGLSVVRNIGLVGLDLLSEAKTIFTKQAMGVGFSQTSI